MISPSAVETAGNGNSRRYPRIEGVFPVRVQEATGRSWTADAVNLSPFGIKIRGTQMTVPAIVRLEFELPVGPARLSLTAVAVRSDPDGTAFAFINLARADFQRIRHAVEHLFVRRRLWIMIVEDEWEVGGLLADFAEEQGYATIIVPSAEEALAYLTQDQPDAILLDLTLPRMSGLQFLETLVRQELRIPVVVVSGAAEPEAASCLSLGALDFIRKPLSFEQFRLTLDMLELTTVKHRLHDIDLALDLAFR